jgi:hypothetical protein
MPDVGSNQAFDTRAELDPILRKKKLIEDMLKARYAASLNDSPVVDAGPGAVKPVNWAGPLGRVVEGLGAQYHMTSSIKRKKTSLRQRKPNDKRAWMQRSSRSRLISTRKGTIRDLYPPRWG